MGDAATSYLQYHARFLAPRAVLLAVGAAASAALHAVVLAGPGERWVELGAAALFALTAYAGRRDRRSILAVLALNVLTTTLLLVDGGGDPHSATWAALSVVAYFTLAPLPFPLRELQAVAWCTLAALAARAHDPEAATGIGAAVVVGYIGSGLVGRSWRQAWEDRELQRQLAERLADARDALERAVTETREELARQQDQLVMQERLATLGRLAAGIAHEINNPLAVAMANLELASDEPAPELLADARAALTRIRTIVADLSRVARPGDLDQVEDLPLAPALHYALDLAHVVVKGQLRIHVDTLPGTVVRANRGRLEQVVVNLLVNAWQAMEARGHGTVRISAVPEGAFVHVHVDDDGPGVPAEILGNIFEPFFTTKASGSGLGLPISRSYLRGMAGDLVATTSPLGGARFTLVLPQADAKARPSVPGREVEPVAPKTAIQRRPTPIANDTRPGLLVIDDEASLRRSLTRGLRGEWRVYAVATGAEALSTVRGERIDVVLCDLVLASEDGMDVLRALAAEQPSLLDHTVLMTGEPTGSALLAMARLNARHLVRKPFDLADLRKHLADALAGQGTIQLEAPRELLTPILAPTRER